MIRNRLLRQKVCSVEGCDRVLQARGFCNGHYAKFYAAVLQKTPVPLRECPECGKRLNRNNRWDYCYAHRFKSERYRAEMWRRAAESRNKHRERYRPRFRELNKISSAKWRAKNREKKREIDKRWKANNLDRDRKIQKRARIKLRSTTHGKLRHRIEVRLRTSLKDMKAGRKWETLLGYTVDQLRAHLEGQFPEGMTWERFHAGEVHIDHIRPVSMFIIESTDDQAFKDCWALSNLQPLWVADHRIKSGAESSVRAKTDRLRERDELTRKRREIR